MWRRSPPATSRSDAGRRQAIDRCSRYFLERGLSAVPGACEKAEVAPALGFAGAVFFGFLGSLVDLFCPLAIAASIRICRDRDRSTGRRPARRAAIAHGRNDAIALSGRHGHSIAPGYHVCGRPLWCTPWADVPRPAALG
jgi:hypothetical protein